MNAPCDRTAWLLGGKAACNLRPLRPAQPRRIVLLGPPGIGKGTQAKLLGAALGACYLSIREILRASPAAAPGPALRVARDYLRRGDRVPDDAILGLINERTRCLTCAGGFILDGFPRTVRQAEALDLLLQKNDEALDAVVLYELPVPANVPRLLGRRTCPACQRTYHVRTLPPRVAGICDDCQIPLAQQREDRIDSIRLLQHTCAMSPRSLLHHYEERGLLVTVSAQGTPEEVFLRTIDAFPRVPAARPAWNAETLARPDPVHGAPGHRLVT